MLTAILLFLQTWAGILTAIAAIVSVIAAFYYKVLKPKIIKPLSDRFQKIDNISATLGPNGGTSLYDKITSMDKKISLGDARGAALNSMFGLVEWHADAMGQTLKINDVACRICMRPETDFMGNNWMNVIHDEDQEAVLKEWADSLRNHKDFKMKYKWTTSNGDPVVVEAIAKPVYDCANKLIAYLGTAKISR